MVKDYYAILGVLPTATLEEIRSAYRNLAKQFHPDHFGRDSAPFLSLQEAYEILGDPESRSIYDEGLRKAAAKKVPQVRPRLEIIRPRRPAAEPLRRSREPLDLGSISPLTSFHSCRPSFDEVFEELWTSHDRAAQSKAERHRTLTMEILLTRDQARRGGTVRVLVPVEAECPRCGGFGETGFFQCWICGGAGTSLSEFPLEVEYPPGIQDHYQVAIPLARFGLPDLCPVLLFRISTEADFESF
jgi:DnaJ-class molecular chaperone